MNDNNNKLQKIIQGGAVGICVLLIILIAYQLKLNNELVSNHMSESTAAIKESTKTQIELRASLDRLSGILRFQAYGLPPGMVEEFEI